MKTTGLFRHVDRLGRVVIPKEIRNTCNVKEGTYMEFFLEGDMICIRRENTPLTEKELMHMVGEPVFVVPLGQEYREMFRSHWCVMNNECAEVPGFEHFCWPLKDYGKDWVAYRYRTAK